METPPPPRPPGAHPGTAPGRREPLVFFAVLLVLALPDLFAQAADRVLGLAWSELFTMLLPAAVAAAGSNLRVRPYLGFERPRPLPVALGALAGAAGFVAANGIMALWVIALPPRVLRMFPDVGRIFEGPPLVLAALVAVAAVLAPVCEEAAFRGYLQRTLARAAGPAPAIAAAALLFALRHLDPVRFPALVFLGAVFGWLSWRSGSLWPAVAAHAANNACAVALALTVARGTSVARPALQDALPPLVVGGAMLAALGGAFHLATRSAPGAPELPLRDPGDPSTRFRLRLVPDTLAAAVVVGLLGLAALLVRSAP